jgi:hypothetical protein
VTVSRTGGKFWLVLSCIKLGAGDDANRCNRLGIGKVADGENMSPLFPDDDEEDDDDVLEVPDTVDDEPEVVDEDPRLLRGNDVSDDDGAEETDANASNLLPPCCMSFFFFTACPSIQRLSNSVAWLPCNLILQASLSS